MERVEKKLQGMLAQVAQTVGADRVTNLLGSALVGAVRTKATLDRNVDALMAMANLPTRGDYRRMQTKLDSLQGSLMNLTRAVEELRGTVSNGGVKSTRAPTAGGQTKRTSAKAGKAAGPRRTTTGRTRKKGS